jgi:hypothetical protein
MAAAEVGGELGDATAPWSWLARSAFSLTGGIVALSRAAALSGCAALPAATKPDRCQGEAGERTGEAERV